MYTDELFRIIMKKNNKYTIIQMFEFVRFSMFLKEVSDAPPGYTFKKKL